MKRDSRNIRIGYLIDKALEYAWSHSIKSPKNKIIVVRITSRISYFSNKYQSLKDPGRVICKKWHRWICSGWCGQIRPARQSIHCAIRGSDLASSSGNVGVSTKDHPHLEQEERSVTVGRRGVTKRRGGSSCASVSLYPIRPSSSVWHNVNVAW